MKIEKSTGFAITCFLLAIGIVICSYFLFYRKGKTPQEVAKESKIEASANTNATTIISEIQEDSLTDEPIEEPESFETKEITGKEIRLNDSISVIPKNIIVVGVEDCEDQYTWEEIKLKNTKVAKTINKEIKEFVQTALSDCLISDQPCGNCDLSGDIYYLSPKMIGVALFASEPIVGRMQHHQNIFYVKPATGQKINFRDFLKPEKAAAFDSVFMARLNKEHDVPVEKHYRDQLENPKFYIEPTEITFTFYDMVGNYIIDSKWKMEEIQPYLKIPFPKNHIQ